MAEYKLTLTLTDTNINALRKKVAAALGKDEVAFSVEKIERNRSRADRLGEAESLVETAKSIVEDLKGEMEEWRDNMPENMQGGDKYQAVSDAADALEEIESNLDQVDFSSVEFPSMMG